MKKKSSLKSYIESMKKDFAKFEEKTGMNYENFFPDNLKTDKDLEERFKEIIKINKGKGVYNKLYNWYVVQAMNLAKRRNEIRDRLNNNSIGDDIYDILDKFYYFVGLKKNESSENLWYRYKKNNRK